MDRAKTLTQLPGGEYGKNMTVALRRVCQQEGLLPGLYRGLPVAMVRESSKNMFRIGLFGPILKLIHPDEDNAGPAPAWKRFLAGTITGALGAVTSNPFDLVKTRMQVPAAMSEYNGMRQCMSAIARQEGLGTFYNGVGASVTRDMLGSSVNLTVQSLASEWFIKNHILTPGSPVLGAISGILSAASAVAVMQPIDTARAYVYLQPGVHANVIAAFRHIILKEGPWSLYKGSKAHFFRTAPHYALMFSLLETITGVERKVIHKRNKEIVDSVPIFGALAEEQRDKLAHGVRVQNFKRGEVIVHEGDADDREMYVIMHGAAQTCTGDVALSGGGGFDGDNGDGGGGSRDGDAGGLWRGLPPLTKGKKKKKRQRPGSTASVDMSEGLAKGDACRSGAEGDGWCSEGMMLGAGDYFGEEALLVDEPRAASVVATSTVATCMIVDRVAYEVATRGTPENVFHSRTRAVTDMEMMWRRLRFQRELQRVPLLAELDPYERALLAKQCVRVSFEPGAHIMHQGDKGDKFYILLHGGAVAVKREADASSSGKVAPQLVLRSYGPGAHFGELALLTDQPRRNTVIATERVEALIIDKNALMELRSTVPTLEDHIVRGMRHYDHIEQFTSMAMA